MRAPLTADAATETIGAMGEVLTLIRTHAWLALAVVVVGFLTRLTAKDSRFPLNIPDQWHPVIALALGIAADGLAALVAGKRWEEAFSPALVIGLAVLVLKAWFHGREPAWLQALAQVVPTRTTTQNVTGPATVVVPVPEGVKAEVEVIEPEKKDTAS